MQCLQAPNSCQRLRVFIGITAMKQMYPNAIYVTRAAVAGSVEYSCGPAHPAAVRCRRTVNGSRGSKHLSAFSFPEPRNTAPYVKQIQQNLLFSAILGGGRADRPGPAQRPAAGPLEAGPILERPLGFSPRSLQCLCFPILPRCWRNHWKGSEGQHWYQ